MESCFVMTLLATIQIRSHGELTAMHIFVAIQTGRKLYLVEGGFARRGVTLRANYLGMFFTEREGGLIVFGDSILGGLEPIYGMA